MVKQVKAVVSEVLDGDTIKISPLEKDDRSSFIKATERAKVDKSGNYTVRLAHIDAPEKSQPFGFNSKTTLSSLLPIGSIVTIEILKGITYGRLIGEIFNEKGRNVNKQMVQEGCAYIYHEHFRGDSDYEILESQARHSHKGVWSLPPDQREKPQDYRRRTHSHRKYTHKTKRKTPPPHPPPPQTYHDNFINPATSELSLAPN